MISKAKRIAASLPLLLQQELKRWYFFIKIRTGHFKSEEPEYTFIDKYIKRSDWVLDIGANIGHYTILFSRLAGPDGRVIAFEPVPETFDLLSTNVLRFQYRNVTLLNAAVSDCSACLGVEVPKFDSGLNNYYEAHLSKEDSKLKVISLSIDSLCIPHPISLIKIDVEGHEFSVLKGMICLLERDIPTLVIEGNSSEVDKLLSELGYSSKKLSRSPNKIFFHKSKALVA